MTALSDFQSFVTNMNSSQVYKNWAVKNSSDASKWQTYSKAILAGQNPAAPTMAVVFGKALVNAGQIYLDSLAPAPTTTAATYGTATYGVSKYDTP